ncbi:hypothetical protein V1512DRAFT_77743 [Lipomyces arxii]|uniref:uncharacterized protein n=1 Tax=Lipomyces arxii TaxID=56418 RepID=UPI0034CDE8E3
MDENANDDSDSQNPARPEQRNGLAFNLHTLADATVANLDSAPLQPPSASPEKIKNGLETGQGSPSNSSVSESYHSNASSPETNEAFGGEGGGHMSARDSTSMSHGPAKRRKVDHACVYCRRSHMTCDSGRPCSRCVKRNIGHLCHDENKEQKQRSVSQEAEDVSTSPYASKSDNGKNESKVTAITYGISSQGVTAPLPNTEELTDEWPAALTGSTTVLANLTPYQPPLFYSEHAGSEFSSLNDFLTMLEETPIPQQQTPQPLSSNPMLMQSPEEVKLTNGQDEGVRSLPDADVAAVPTAPGMKEENHLSATANGNLTLTTATKPLQVPETAKDKFFLTAADPADGPEHTPEERLKQVINAKLEAGLLAPFNYVKGYARLQRYMDRHMSPVSRQRILKPLSIFRPAFRAIAQTLIDVDLVLVEEAFERMLLDYDRVFTSMAIPACLWRRTGEIYRGNKEFAALVEVPVEELRDGKLAIYEMLSEDSAVNYWEKYGNIAFDSGQKAVLTSCTLKARDGTRRSCCFSFTIRRDRYNIPSCIIGNFIPIHP